MLLAGAILDRFAALFALLHYLEFEATAFTNIDLAQFHVVAACHFFTSAQIDGLLLKKCFNTLRSEYHIVDYLSNRASRTNV